MKKKFVFFLLAASLLTSCEKVILTESDSESETVSDGSPVGNAKKFTFTIKGDFSDNWKPVGTRGYLAADGKDLTDVWVLDYQGGALVQQLHQSDNTAEDFGHPTMNLAYGSHHIYIIATRSTGATLDTDTHTLSFAKVLDTFYKDYEVSVVSTSNGNRAVTLDRVVTRLRLTFDDAISTDAATINIAPHTWHYGWNYVTGTPADTRTDQVTTITIPSSEIGKTGVQANLFGFSSSTEWTTDIAINSKSSPSTVIGQTTITDAPFRANRITEYSGPLFGSEGAMTLSLNSSWDDAYNGTW